MPLTLQAKLLRAIQDKTVRPVGGSQETALDFRLITASNRDLSASVHDGGFRDDLYYRLAVIPIRLPSLRERPDDIPALAEYFLDRRVRAHGYPLEGYDEGAVRRLCEHRWPGNVRELENAIERAAALARGPRITVDDLVLDVAGPLPNRTRPTLAELERRYAEQVLVETGGDKQRVARILDVSVRTLQRWAKRR